MSPETIRREERLNDVVETPLFRARAPSEDEQGYLLDEMLSTLGDVESEGYYRRLASTVPKDIIFEALSLVKRAVHEGKIRIVQGRAVRRHRQARLRRAGGCLKLRPEWGQAVSSIDAEHYWRAPTSSR
jgi:hypothetical protein